MTRNLNTTPGTYADIMHMYMGNSSLDKWSAVIERRSKQWPEGSLLSSSGGGWRVFSPVNYTSPVTESPVVNL